MKVKNNEKLAHVLIDRRTTIKHAMCKLNETGMQILLVVDARQRLTGTVTDGDIRRALIGNIRLTNSVSKIMNKEPKHLYENEKDRAGEFMKQEVIQHVPILNKKDQVVDIISWKDVNAEEEPRFYAKKDNIVFIMAGGKGTRLDPFTKIMPKPLIPSNDKPIIEIIMENFKKYGLNNFIISVNYKREMIKMYFKENPQDFNIRYLEEKDFLGTAGSLALIKKKIDKPVIVSNCDVILDICFEDLLNHHVAEKNDFTIVGIVRHIKIPYGVLKMKNGSLSDIVEKPEYDFVVNAGIYVISPKVIKLIADHERVDMPDLILKARKKGYRVSVYPLSRGWTNVEHWEGYRTALEHFRDVGAI